MRKTLSISLICLLFIFLFDTCKKSTTTSAPTIVDSMSFKSDGVFTKMSHADASTYTSTNVGGNAVSIFSIVGSATTTLPLLAIYMKYPAVGTYILNGITSPAYIEYIESSGNQNLYISTSGTLFITSLTATNVTGTFQCTAITEGTPYKTRNITEGVFNCTIKQR